MVPASVPLAVASTSEAANLEHLRFVLRDFFCSQEHTGAVPRASQQGWRVSTPGRNPQAVSPRDSGQKHLSSFSSR